MTTDYTEADVERLAEVLSEAQKRGIKHGSYTLARWILTAWSVEGGASPARVGICGDSAPQIFPNTVPVVCSLPHGHAGWHHADGGGDWSERAPADEPAPVPPPVDALRCFEHDFSVVAEHTEGDVTVCLGCGERGDEAGPGWLDRLVTAAVAYGDRREVDSAGSDMYHSASDDTLDVLIAEIKTVWAAGVAEGHRERVAQSNGCPQCALDDTVPDLEGDHVHLTDYGYLLFTPGHTARDYAAELIAEGRRQAAAAIRAADTSGWPGGRGGDVDECQELSAKIAEVPRG